MKNKWKNKWEEEFDKRFDNRLFEERRNADWIKKGLPKYDWFDVTDDVKEIIQQALANERKRIADNLKKNPDIEALIMKIHLSGYIRGENGSDVWTPNDVENAREGILAIINKEE